MYIVGRADLADKQCGKIEAFDTTSVYVVVKEQCHVCKSFRISIWPDHNSVPFIE